MSILLGELDPASRVRVRTLYDALAALLGKLRIALRLPGGDGRAPGGFSHGSPDLYDADVQDVEAARVVLRDTAGDPAWREAIEGARALRMTGVADDRVREAVHDIRGGALTALVLTLDLLARRDISAADVIRTFYLTRDQLKIMRNALEDVDVVARERDLAPREHGTHMLFEKWANASHRPTPECSARIHVDSTYEGPVSRRCLEFSALDRVLYNLLNNAARFASDGEVALQVRPFDASLRFVVVNTISSQQRETIHAAHGGELGALFRGEFTTGGSGVGLGICAEFVANAYGLEGVEQAIRGGYVGARMVNDSFVAWFHWPMSP